MHCVPDSYREAYSLFVCCIVFMFLFTSQNLISFSLVVSSVSV